MGRKANNHTAFVCIKTTHVDIVDRKKATRGQYLVNLDDDQGDSKNRLSFVLPIELEVSHQEGLFSPIDTIEFGPISVKNSDNSTNINDKFVTTGDLILSTASVQPLTSPFLNQHNMTSNFFRTFELYLTNSASSPLEIKVIFLFLKEVYCKYFVKFFFYKKIRLSRT